MRTERIFRHVVSEQGRRASGTGGRTPRHWARQAEGNSYDFEMLQIPIAVDEQQVLQDGTGFRFQAGVSRVGGPDKIG